MPKEQYMCQLCANHGVFNQPKKGHKQKCPHRNCSCHLCALNTKRRALDQIERQLRNSATDSPVVIPSNNTPSPSSSSSVFPTSMPSSLPMPMPIFPTSIPASMANPFVSIPQIPMTTVPNPYSVIYSNENMPSTSKFEPTQAVSKDTLSSPSSKHSISNSSNGHKNPHKPERNNPDVFCVALPPTITRKELKNAKKLQLQREKALKGQLLEATVEQLSQIAKLQQPNHVKKANGASEVSKSIFCSVEMLAESG